MRLPTVTIVLKSGVRYVNDPLKGDNLTTVSGILERLYHHGTYFLTTTNNHKVTIYASDVVRLEIQSAYILQSKEREIWL
jgi:hypothetical protein